MNQTSRPQVSADALAQLQQLRPPKSRPFQSDGSGPQGTTQTLSPTKECRDGVQEFRLDLGRSIQTESMLDGALRRLLVSQEWTDLQSQLDTRMQHLAMEADTVKLSNEYNLSHWLKSSMFDIIHIIIWTHIKGDTRYWRALGTGRRGTCDYGFYVNNKLVIVLELKPSSVVTRGDLAEIVSTLNRQHFLPFPSKSADNSTGEDILRQIRGEFCHPEAVETALHAVCLNETTTKASGAAILFTRADESYWVHNEYFDDDKTPTQNSLVVNPFTLVLALSCLTPSQLNVATDPTSPNKPETDQGGSSGGEDSDSSSDKSPGSGRRGQTNTELLHNPSGSSNRSSRAPTKRQSDGPAKDHGQGSSEPSSTKRPRNHHNMADLNIKVHPPKTHNLILSVTGDSDSSQSDGDGSSSVSRGSSPSTALSSPPATAVELERMPPAFSVDIGPTSMTWYGPVKLPDFAVESLPDVNESTSALSIEDLFSLATLTPESRRGKGAVWKTWSANTTAHFPQRSIIKICHLGEFSDDPQSDEDDGRYSRSDVKRAVRHEYEVLTGPLASLQHSTTPKLLGCYVALDKASPVWSFVMEDAGDPVVVDSLLYHQKRIIVEQYKKLHAHGVLHKDCNPRNWLQRFDQPDQIRIVDFERSQCRSTRSDWKDDTAWFSECAKELRRVSNQLQVQSL